MKKIVVLLLSMIFIVACKKDKTLDVVPEVVKTSIENTLITGTNCSQFYRLIEGSRMEDIYSVKQTLDGGYILCGSTATIAESEYDILVIKTNCFGETEWMKTISNNFTDSGYDIIQISTGEYLVAASYSLSPAGTSIISYLGQLIKISASGEVIWKNQYDFGSSTQFKKIIENPGGGFIVCGSDNLNGGFVLKIDAAGTEVWRNDLENNTRLFDIALTTSLNYLVCGSVSVNQQEDLFIAELNTVGDTLWTKTIDKNNITNEAASIAVLGNDFIICGYNRTSGIDLPGFAMKLDATGNEIWYKSLETEGIGTLTNIVITQDNEVLGTGSKSNGTSLVKINSSNGSIIWETLKPSNQIVRDLQLCNDAGFILTGNKFVSTGNRDGFILKTDVNGN